MRHPRLARVLLAVLAVVPLALFADQSWTVPGIVNAAGLNGTHFVSDLTLTNPGAATTNVTLSFFPGASAPKHLTLNPGQTVAYSDVAGVTFGVSGGAGALAISAAQPLLIRAKTYNTAASGTYGVSLPVVALDRLLASGDVAESLWITQDASGAAGFRTNVAVVFTDASGGSATVTIYDAEGNARGSQDYSLPAPGLQQFSVGSFAGAVPVGRAEVLVTSGHASAYAVVVDNVTGDSSLFAFEDRPAGIQDVLVNGVARANGRNAAFFRTDGRFYNPTDTDATVNVSFHANQGANPSPQTASFVLPAGKIRDVEDVLDTLLGLPVGSAGALRFQSNWPVAILCRTSNVDPSGARPGTFGSQQKPVPLLSFVNSADAGAAVTGIRQDAAFRTNVGFAAGADGASYTLTLQDASGAAVATTSASLGAFGWTQPGIQDLFPTTTIPQNATLAVKVTQGSVDVFDSSIDNLSGDPVVTPIAPLPAAIPSSASIGSAGGSIRSDDGRLTLRVPAGALASPVSLTLQTTTNDAPEAVGSGYQILPSGTAFAKKALLTLSYSGDDTDGADSEALTVAVSSGSGWFALGGGSIDPVRRTLTVRLGSTAPSSPAPAPPGAASASRSLASPVGVLGITTNWRLEPRRPVAILTGSTVLVSVSYIGPSSSTDPDEAFLLPTKPADVRVTWLVNGSPSGPVVGGGTQGTYTAPSCPPRRNPVKIEANISSSVVGLFRYRVAGSVRVRVVPRDWLLDWIVDATLACDKSAIAEVSGIMASDHVSWIGPGTTIKFSLSESGGLLSVFDQGYQIVALPSHNLKACPCFGNTPAIKEYGIDRPLSVPFGAVWDEVSQRMHLGVSSDYAYDGGVVTCTNASGQTLDSGDLSQAWGLQIPAGLNLRSGDRGTLPPATDGDWTVSVSYYLRSVCP